MSTWYNKIVADISQIADCIDYYERELVEARRECQVHGVLEKLSAQLSGITEHRFAQLQEIEAVLEHLHIELRRERSRVFRMYLEKYQRQLSSRDAEKYVDGEDTVIDLTHVINQFSLLRNRYLGVLKGLDIKQWQIGHITKLRAAGLEDVFIE